MSARQLQFDPEEEQALIANYGPTKVREYQFDLDPVSYRLWWRSTALGRRAEVVMIVHVSSSTAGEACHDSHRPANANGFSSRMRMK